MHVKKLLLGLILLMPTALWAELCECPPEGFWSIQLENDLWGRSDDRFYTHGTKLSYVAAESTPEFLQKLPNLVPFYRKGDVQIFGLEIAQTIFTPEDIEHPNLIEDDRPYAGWLYVNLGIGDRFEDKGDRDRANFVGLTLGIVGPSSLAEQMQKEVHRLFDADDPNGWDNQLEDEIGINLGFLRKSRRIFNFDEPRQYELGGHSGFVIGNVYTYAAVGFMARYGTHLKADLGPPSIAPGFSGVPAFNPNREEHWYLFGGLEFRAMARNIFLDGNTIVDSHSVEKEDFVGDLQFGFAYHFNDMRLSFVQMFRTREFEGQSEPVQYGAINLTVFTF